MLTLFDLSDVAVLATLVIVYRASVIYAWCSGEGRTTAAATAALQIACWITFLQSPRVAGWAATGDSQWHSITITTLVTAAHLCYYGLDKYKGHL